jgi:hypothetical protein
MKTERARVGLGLIGEGAGVHFDRRLYGPPDLVD